MPEKVPSNRSYTQAESRMDANDRPGELCFVTWGSWDISRLDISSLNRFNVNHSQNAHHSY